MLKVFKNLNHKKRGLTVSFILLVAVFLFLFSVVYVAHAQEIGLNRAANLGLVEANEKDPRDLIVNIIKYFLTFLGLIAVVMVMYSGFLWMTSDGDPEKLNKAKSTLINSIIGLVIALSAFAIVSFVANMMNGGSGHSGIGGGGGPKVPHGYGVIGACSVESVYPEPGQKDVPRDTAIMVTFKEEVNIDTMRSGTNINTNRIKIFHKNEAEACLSGGTCSSLITQAGISESTDHKTFVISPTNYLGSPSEYIEYSVYFSNEIEKLSDGSGIFSTCQSDFLRWDFEVSNKLDMIPPRVKKKGIFPEPDNDKDGLILTDAVQAIGSITIDNNPNVFKPAETDSLSASPASANAGVNVGDVCSEGGSYIIDISASNLNQARLRRGTVLLGSAGISENNIHFSYCDLSLELNSGTFEEQCSGGCVWDFNITASEEADTLTIDSDTYVFGEDIPIGSNENDTAQNLTNFINGARSDLNASLNGNVVNLRAIVAGTVGNNILLDTNNHSNISISSMSGGVDLGESYEVRGQRDKARNAVIQINFNEAINPLTVSGNAGDLANYIRVKCFENDGVTHCSGPDVFDCGGESCVNGHFEISNQYKTLEFISDNQCGVNSCGENIYCLPGDAKLVVEVEAADLLTCPPTDCSTKSPYDNCVSGVCENAEGHKLPKALLPATGIIDISNNSLDGNRDTFATGSFSFYNENYPDANDGDNYEWSFYVNNLIDLGAPEILSVNPPHAQADVDLKAPLEITFNKLMMSSSLKSGQTQIFNGRETYRHKLINLWNFADLPLGFWISSENIDISLPLDGVSDQTKAFINHSSFYEAVSYRSQVGSGVKDIYQNCFKPSNGPDCSPDINHPNCCPGTTGLNEVDNSGINSDTGNCD